MKSTYEQASVFPFSSDNKRYHTLHYHLMQKFGCRVEKAAIDGGFACPNVDGTCGTGGCTFCLNGAGEFTPSAALSVTKQLVAESARIRKKCGVEKVIAYFQANTNTYAPCDVLRAKFQEALSFPNVVGLSIGTRPDCINRENAELLASLAEDTYLTVELGLQTIHDETAEKFHRGYTYDTFLQAFHLLKQKHIRVCVHLINGLYGETREDMVESARVLAKLQPDGVKIHSLHILKGTQAAKHFADGTLVPMTKDGYIDVVCRQLSVLPQSCVIERLTGDGPKDKLLAPRWSSDKISVLAGIDKEMQARSLYQGEFFEE